MDIHKGLLNTAKICLSPHFNERPANAVIDMIVIHNISLPPGKFGGSFIEDFFCGKLDFSLDPYFETIQELRVSSHIVIDRNGLITQFVPFHLRAWHAGESSWQGLDNCNDYSIGIELEGTDDLAYTDLQYSRLKQLINTLQYTYPAISDDRIVGHCDIAPGRKTDPGSAFQWSVIRGE